MQSIVNWFWTTHPPATAVLTAAKFASPGFQLNNCHSARCNAHVQSIATRYTERLVLCPFICTLNLPPTNGNSHIHISSTIYLSHPLLRLVNTIVVQKRDYPSRIVTIN